MDYAARVRLNARCSNDWNAAEAGSLHEFLYVIGQLCPAVITVLTLACFPRNDIARYVTGEAECSFLD